MNTTPASSAAIGRTPVVAEGPSDERAAAAVELIGVSKSYGSALAVSELDLQIGQGEFFALLGPSGCGKTTTLKMMAGFEHPDAGEIRLEGSDVTEQPAFRRDVNLVFQDYALFPHLNLRDNVAFGLKIKGVGRRERRKQAEAMLERVALPGVGDRRTNEISGGQQQRVALARALINRPKVLLLDEPLGALDLKLRREMQLELKAIQRDAGISFIYVTHDQEEALAMADRIAVMNAGQALQVDLPRQIYDHPGNRFIANFIGESSFLEGSREGTASDGRAVFRLASGERLHARLGGGPPEGAVAMVRPEYVEIGAAGETGVEQTDLDTNRVKATVAELEYGGSDVHYFLETASRDRLQSRMPAAARTFEPGSQIIASFPVDKTVLVG